MNKVFLIGNLTRDPARAGETFNGFMAMLTTGIRKDHPASAEACEFLKIPTDSVQAERLARGLGYKAEWKIIKACDEGTPTLRKRFYMVARRDGKSVVFPKPTYGKGDGLKPYRTAAECIDKSIPCPSIFDRKKALAVNTLRRIARELDKFVIKNPQPYKMSNNTNNACHGVNEPMPTVTTGNRNFLCSAYITKYFSGEQQKGADINEPLPSVTAIDHNAVVAANIVHYYGGADHASKVDSPLPTITTKPRHYLTESHLCVLRNNMGCEALNQPIPTITAKQHEALITTYIQKLESAQDLKNWHKVRKLLNDYAGYNIAEDEILIIEINGVQHFIADVGMRMLKAKELKLAQGFPEDYIR